MGEETKTNKENSLKGKPERCFVSVNYESNSTLKTGQCVYAYLNVYGPVALHQVPVAALALTLHTHKTLHSRNCKKQNEIKHIFLFLFLFQNKFTDRFPTFEDNPYRETLILYRNKVKILHIWF